MPRCWRSRWWRWCCSSCSAAWSRLRCPVIVGGLSIAGALGIMRLVAAVTGPVHFFAQPVVTLIGLGIAIDYGLFMVSRFREEIAEGYDTETAVRRTVMTSGRTVMFSAVLIVASLAAAAVPAGLPEVDHLRHHRLGHAGGDPVDHRAGRHAWPCWAATSTRSGCARCCGSRSWPTGSPMNWWLNFLADKTQKTKTREEVENGFWGKLVNRVMKRPILFAAPILIVMILLIIPLGQLALGGISEKYLPPDNSVRQAQEEFDKTFPGFRTEPLTLVIQSDQPGPAGRRDPQQGDAHQRLHQPDMRRAQRSPPTPTETRAPRRTRSVGSIRERPGGPQRRGQEDHRPAVDPRRPRA